MLPLLGVHVCVGDIDYKLPIPSSLDCKLDYPGHLYTGKQRQTESGTVCSHWRTNATIANAAFGNETSKVATLTSVHNPFEINPNLW